MVVLVAVRGGGFRRLSISLSLSRARAVRAVFFVCAKLWPKKHAQREERAPRVDKADGAGSLVCSHEAIGRPRGATQTRERAIGVPAHRAHTPQLVAMQQPALLRGLRALSSHVAAGSAPWTRAFAAGASAVRERERNPRATSRCVFLVESSRRALSQSHTRSQLPLLSTLNP